MTNVKCGCTIIVFLCQTQEYEMMQNSNCTWICPKCDFFQFLVSFFNGQFDLESENRFDLLAKSH